MATSTALASAATHSARKAENLENAAHTCNCETAQAVEQGLVATRLRSIFRKNTSIPSRQPQGNANISADQITLDQLTSRTNHQGCSSLGALCIASVQT